MARLCACSLFMLLLADWYPMRLRYTRKYGISPSTMASSLRGDIIGWAFGSGLSPIIGRGNSSKYYYNLSKMQLQ
ncbi:hypothetical protein BJY01DRAFT_228656 [Aspergillus pseudoustus]|uniref:Uncharacterized protein n=1 Tax=Aspergillus pseudoustus TaxID=1810923 RepID=A0ABR4IMM3_9EURO